jgi:hypothetical protein
MLKYEPKKEKCLRPRPRLNGWFGRIVNDN